MASIVSPCTPGSRSPARLASYVPTALRIVTHDEYASLVSRLESFAGRAWIARKVLARDTDAPYYVLLVQRAEPWWRFVSDGSTSYLASKLAEELTFPGDALVVILTRKRRWLSRMIKRVPGSELYRRDTRARATLGSRGHPEPAPE